MNSFDIKDQKMNDKLLFFPIVSLNVDLLNQNRDDPFD